MLAYCATATRPGALSAADPESLVVDLNPFGLPLVVDVGHGDGRHVGLAQEVRVLVLMSGHAAFSASLVPAEQRPRVLFVLYSARSVLLRGFCVCSVRRPPPRILDVSGCQPRTQFADGI